MTSKMVYCYVQVAVVPFYCLSSTIPDIYAKLLTVLSMHTVHVDQTLFLVEVNIKSTMIFGFSDGVRTMRK